MPPSRRLSQLQGTGSIEGRGVYVLSRENREKVYVGETLDLSKRLFKHKSNPINDVINVSIIPMPNTNHEMQGLQSILIGRYDTPLNYKKLAFA